jgi:hypothetical protein
MTGASRDTIVTAHGGLLVPHLGPCIQPGYSRGSEQFQCFSFMEAELEITHRVLLFLAAAK